MVRQASGMLGELRATIDGCFGGDVAGDVMRDCYEASSRSQFSTRSRPYSASAGDSKGRTSRTSSTASSRERRRAEPFFSTP